MLLHVYVYPTCMPAFVTEWKLPWISNDVFIFKGLELREHFKKWIMILGDFFLHGCSELPENRLLKLLSLMEVVTLTKSFGKHWL